MSTTTTSNIERVSAPDWYADHHLLLFVARYGVSQIDELDGPSAVVDFFEKPYNYAALAQRAAAEADLEQFGATFVARSVPAYTKVRFSVNGSKILTGLTRSLPQTNSSYDRRITVLDTGTEFFVEPTTEFDSFEIVEFDSRG